ncbi:MAG: Na/Pi cotransporter family protein [Oscillospiraceae bacterium]|nr:Na/Pi cotransporter family protein [Oscillospiraceae bacterium]
MSFQDVLSMIAGLCVFMFGMHTLSSALEKFAGSRIETLLNKMTSNPIKGVALGAAVTALLQSSAATTVMMVGFVNSGLLKLSQVISVIMGANIGTTATAWLVSLSSLAGSDVSGIMSILNFNTIVTIIAVVGIVFAMFTKSDKKKTVGYILVGFSLLMIGMNMMSGASETLKDNPDFTKFMAMFSNPVLGVVAGALLTAVLQSSSVSIGILQSISNQTGTVTYKIALPILLGQNIGSCVTALISSIGANKAAKRVAIVHLYFNLIGTVVFLGLFYLVTAFIDIPVVNENLNAVGIAIVHSCFNILATALFLPFTKQLEKLACLTIRDSKDDEMKMPILDKRLLNTPAVAIEQCKNVAYKMADLTHKTLLMSIDLVNNYDPKIAAEIVENENTIDIYEDKIGSYILQVASKDLTVSDSQVVSNLLHTIGDLERISDHAVNITEAAEEMHDKKIKFSPAAEKEMAVMTAALREILDMSFSAFLTNDVALAKEVEPLEDVIDGIRTELKSRHVERLRNGICTIELGFILQDLLTNYERVSDHCSNIAVCLIQIKENSLDTHEYINELKKLEKSEFMDEFNDYRSKYLLPD